MGALSKTAKPVKGGLIIVFEGMDGVGKTTQLNMAKELLVSEGWPVDTIRNLGGTPIGEELRKVILSPLNRPSTTNLHISVAIQEALIEAVKLKRQAGKIILMDRGPLSLAAYEIYGGKLDESVGWPYVEAGMDRLKPELTLIYNADVDAALGRVRAKAGQTDYFESKPLSYFEQVAEGYQQSAKRYPDSVEVIDANQPIEPVHLRTMQVIRELLRLYTEFA